MPRAIGASTGVKLTETGDAVTALRFWVITGVWRWVATPEALVEPMTSAASIGTLADLPAPEAPVTDTTVMSEASTSPAATAGSSARVAPVGKQPGTATRRVFRSASRAPGNSGSPYGQVPAWGEP